MGVPHMYATSEVSHLQLKLACVCTCVQHACMCDPSTHMHIQPFTTEISMCVCVKYQFFEWLI